MGLNAKKSKNNTGSTIPLMDAGMYPARLLAVVDCGLQEQRPFRGQQKEPAYEILLTYEICNEFLEDEDGNPDQEKPRIISEIMPAYSLEADRAKSTQRYKALDPDISESGDWTALIGRPCMVNVTVSKPSQKTGRQYNNISAVAPPMKGFQFPDMVLDPIVFDMDNPEADEFLKMPNWIQDKCKRNLEFAGSKLEAILNDVPVDDDDDEMDDVPF